MFQNNLLSNKYPSDSNNHLLYFPGSILIPTYPEFLTSLGPDGSLIVWVDFMKWGVLPANDLNGLVNMVKKALAALPERSCCFAIAPQSTSERRGGLRDEFRIGLCYPKHLVLSCSIRFYHFFFLWMKHKPLKNWGCYQHVVFILHCALKQELLTHKKLFNSFWVYGSSTWLGVVKFKSSPMQGVWKTSLQRSRWRPLPFLCDVNVHRQQRRCHFFSQVGLFYPLDLKMWMCGVNVLCYKTGPTIAKQFFHKTCCFKKWGGESNEQSNMKQALRTPRDLIPWLPESQYVVPCTRDNLPTAAEGQRRQTHFGGHLHVAPQG